MKTSIIALLAFGTFGMVAMPANADSASIQESEQVNVTTGHGNLSTQVHTQDIRDVRINGGRDDDGKVQKTRQVSDTQGNGNDVLQEGAQVIRGVSVNDGGRRRHR